MKKYHEPKFYIYIVLFFFIIIYAKIFFWFGLYVNFQIIKFQL